MTTLWLITRDELRERLTRAKDKDERKALKQAIYDITEAELGNADREPPKDGPQGRDRHVLRRPERARTP